MIVTSLLQTDFYKITMMQMAFHQQRNRQVKYGFVNRTKGVDLLPYIEEIKNELSAVTKLSFTEDEIQYLRNQGLFQEDFLEFLKTFKLKASQLKVFIHDSKLAIEVSGSWVDTILWEIYVLSVVNEVYFRNVYPDAEYSLTPYDKLAAKINLIKENNQKQGTAIFKFLEFGSRRRYSGAWQRKVLKILHKELPENLVATSNVALAKELGITVSGTAAHEAYAAFQVISGLDKAHQGLWDAWLKEYKDKLGIVLTDIYTTEAFLEDFTLEYATKLKGLRHDSGDPLKWMDKVVAHYKNLGIDPNTKKLVFSDGLNFEKALQILEYGISQYNLNPEVIVFGIGTNLTNDFDHKALNIVMKMIECEGKSVIKISDEITKAIGSRAVIDEVIELYQIKQESA